MKRFLDFILVLSDSLFLALPFHLLWGDCSSYPKGACDIPIQACCKNNTLFKMPKFRTMYLSTPVIAAHLLKNSSQYLTAIESI